MMRARLLTGVAVAAAVAAGGVGGAIIGVPALSSAQNFPGGGTAASTTAGATRAPALLDAAAKALGLTTQQLRDKLSDGKTTIADVANQQHVDLNKVIDAMAGADRDRISNIVNRPWPQRGPFGPGGPAGALPFKPGVGMGIGRVAGVALGDVAKALGISTTELQTDLRNGQSIAEIAKAKHVDLSKVVDSLVSDASARLDQQVKDGHLTQAQADKIKAALKTMITNLVNNGFPKFPGPGRFGHRGFGPGRGFGGPGAPVPPTTATPAA